MRLVRLRYFAIGGALVTFALTWVIPSSYAQGVPGSDPNKCLAGKNKCVSKKIKGLLRCRQNCQKSPAKCGARQTTCETKVRNKFADATNPDKDCFAKLRLKQDPSKPDSICTTTGDAAVMAAKAELIVADILGTLEGSPPPTLAFPASGQTICYDGNGNVVACAGTGQDGDVQAGAPLAHQDNGDGTVTDLNTGLMWAKKSDDGSIHDKDTTYSWADAFTVHVAGLNDVAGGGASCFANYCDWRVPNVRELPSMANYGNIGPAVSPAFNTNCAPTCTVTTCSCTVSSFYWASTTPPDFPSHAWVVNFNNASLGGHDKDTGAVYVRAVRGAL